MATLTSSAQTLWLWHPEMQRWPLTMILRFMMHSRYVHRCLYECVYFCAWGEHQTGERTMEWRRNLTGGWEENGGIRTKKPERETNLGKEKILMKRCTGGHWGRWLGEDNIYVGRWYEEIVSKESLYYKELKIKISQWWVCGCPRKHLLDLRFFHPSGVVNTVTPKLWALLWILYFYYQLYFYAFLQHPHPHMHKHTRTCTHIHTHMYTYTHAHSHVHTQIPPNQLSKQHIPGRVKSN